MTRNYRFRLYSYVHLLPFGDTLRRRDAYLGLKLFAEIVHVGVAAAFGGFFYFIFAASQHIFRVPHAGLYQVLVHGDAGFFFEKSAKIDRVQVQPFRHLAHGELVAVMLGDIAAYFLYPVVGVKGINIVYE
jgi:hypothetical protein